AGTMQPPSACPCRGGIPWQRILLAVSLLTFWYPHPTALLTIEPVPFDAAEGRDVLLLVHNVSENAIGYNWFKGNTANNSFKIISYLVSSQMTTPGPAFNGGEKIYSNGSLLLQKVTQNDTGFYTLQTVTADAIVELATGEFFVHEKLPKPNITINNSQPMEGEDSLALTCEPEINYGSYLWKINNQMIPDGDRLKLMQLSPDHRTLSIDPVRQEDAGEYQCEASNPASSTRSDRYRLAKLPKPNITINNSQPMEGEDSLALTCEPEINYGSYLWKINNQMIPDGDRLKLNDTGPYECETQNPVSANRSDPLTLNISYGPDAPIIKPPDSHFRPGTNLNLSCHADSNPPAQYSWSFNGRLLESTQQLSVPNLSTNNSGSYVCVAHNSVTNFNRTTTKNITVSGNVSPWTQPQTLTGADEG
uniref:Ig-like domain-containing protein n=1 Tax=Marmota marmota marmota TaxID=9994 RepID=A0A8C5ZYP4_MARMA